MGQYLRTIWPSAFGARFCRLRYEDLAGFEPRPGLYVFADIELLDEAGRALALALHARLRTDPTRFRAWNNPGLSTCRFGVLDRLAREGGNRFRAFRVRTEMPEAEDLRYPVFVRDEHEHSGALTGLLSNAGELRAALAALRAGPRAAGQPLLAVEYLDYAGRDGVFRKYSMFRMGECLVRKHVLFSSEWVLREPQAGQFEGPEWLAEEEAFLSGKADAHDADVRRIFDTFAIDYGRIDYAVTDNGIQVFEINTNPMILKPSQLQAGPRRSVHVRFAEQAREAWCAGDAWRPSWGRQAWWRMHKPKLDPTPWWRRLLPGWKQGNPRSVSALLARRESAVLRGRELKLSPESVEVSAVLAWRGTERRLVLSAPAWTAEWIEESYDALVLAALPCLEESGASVRLRVAGGVSAGLLAGLKRRHWLRATRGEIGARSGVDVRAAVLASPNTGAERKIRALVDYRGDVFSGASVIELADGHPLYPRPELAVGGETVPGGPAGAAFLERMGLRYAEVRVERPGPTRPSGGALDAAMRVRFLGRGFGTGYLPATAAYHYGQPEAGEPDADIDPLFSGGGVRVIHHGAHRTLAGTLAVFRRLAPGTLPAWRGAAVEDRAPKALTQAGLMLVGHASEWAGVAGLELGVRRVRWHVLDVLRWLRAEPRLAATAAGAEIDAALRATLGLASGAELPKADASQSPLRGAPRPPDARKNRKRWPCSVEWEDGLALVSDGRTVVDGDLAPIASWMRLRYPGLNVGAERTRTVARAIRDGRGIPPRMLFNFHVTRELTGAEAGVRRGRLMPKSEELAGLERAGVSVPRWRLLQPGETVTEEEFGRYVVVKPDQGLRGAGVHIQKASSVRGEPMHVASAGRTSAPLVQEFIYTGPRAVSYRVGVLFGKAIYRWRVEAREVAGRELPQDGDFRTQSGLTVVSTGAGCGFSDPVDHEVVAFAERASQVFPDIPLMGVDVARRLPDGKLFVLELNSSGDCFHLTSDTGRKIQQTTTLELPEQYGGYLYCAEIYKRVFEREYGW